MRPFAPDSVKPEAGSQVLAALLQKRFGEVFPEELSANDLPLLQQLPRVGPLVTTQADAEHGWLVLAWQRARQTPRPRPQRA